jgi:ABC-type transport system substrate-binding protein
VKGCPASGAYSLAAAIRRRFCSLFPALTVLCGLAALSGCSVKQVTVNSTPGPGGSGTPASNVNLTSNSLRYALTTNPTTLDPATVEDGTTIDLLQQIFEGLVIWNEQSQVAPGIAEKWDISKDGTIYTFHLRHGVKFHNGREVTAEDFKYSIERACDPAIHSPTASEYLADIVGAKARIDPKSGVKEVSGVKVIDPYTLQITIDAYKPYWLGNMTYPTAYVVCKEAIEKSGGKVDESSAIGAGPFKLVEYQPDKQIVLAANPDYYGGKPKLDFIVRPIITDATTRLNNYEADQLDIVGISPRDLDHVNQDEKLKSELKVFPRAATWYVGLNQAASGSPFSNKTLRQAFAMAIDRSEVVRIGLKGQADVAAGIVPPGIGYTPNFKPLSFDPAQAKQLLAQAGYPDGKGFPPLTFSFRQDLPEVADVAQVVASQLKTNLGITVQLRPMEWGQLLNEADHKTTLPLFILRWGADYPDPQDYLSILLHTDKKVGTQEDHPANDTGYSNPQFDQLCDQADVEHDPKKRLALYQQAEQIAVNDAPWVPLFFQKDLELIKPRVGHLRDSAFGHLPHLTTTVTP